ncbi:MAG TPA: hypothetical protein VFP85_18185 [Vicinamibacterales bacterium]|nr:hypothetical protein [Vicinamibacterales bacterium]
MRILGIYAALSVALTWPLVLGLGSDVPGDLGDSLLNMWILAWSADHLPQLLTGAIGWSEFWNGNIFHPEPLTLALSEHLVGQALQILPVYWLTGNIILCYNLLFISTFALSAYGTYLLVRDLTGDARAAFVAGLVYGFLPYRIASVPHLQVMSSQWMPLALWGFNSFLVRFPAPGSRLPSYGALGLGVAALVMQNWSCGYYLLYFAPFLPAFIVYRMWQLGAVKDVWVWASLGAAAAATVVLTLPFLLPYQAAQRMFGIERLIGEVEMFSANVWSYVTASENLALLGRALRFYPHAEGETFLGFIPWLLGVAAVMASIRLQPDATFRRMDRWHLLTWILLTLTVAQLVALLSVVFFGGFEVNVFGLAIRARTPVRSLMQFVAVFGLLLAVSSRTRAASARIVRTPAFFFLALTILAMWLSLGPHPKAGDALVSGFGIYNVLYENVPGFNGVRVPARYAMIAGLFLAVLAGYGARLLTFNLKLLTLVSVLVLAEGAAVPMARNLTWNQNEAVPPARIFPGHSLGRQSLGEGVPAVYRRVAALPAGAAVTELPFGDAAWEIRYVYYAHAHRKPITNGYSGAFPPSYKERVARLQRIRADPEAAWQSLRASGTTHVVLHKAAFARPDDAEAVEAWLRSRGATEVERFEDGAMLFVLTL